MRSAPSSQIEQDIIEVVKEKAVVYQRELQVYLEDKYSHWDVYNRLKVLDGVHLRSTSYRKRKWYWSTEMDWPDVRGMADKVADLFEACERHPRRFERLGITYLDYAEFLVEGALKEAGYVVAAKDTYYFDGVAYVPPAGRGPGRPPDLDFIANIPEKRLFLGVQVKNQLRYPRPEDIATFLDMCKTLGIIPLLITRMAHEMQLKQVYDAGGRFVVFKQLLLKPPFPRDVFNELRVWRGLPIAVYLRVPSFLIDKLIEARHTL